MRTHVEIDRRSLAMVRAIMGRIGQDPQRGGLEKAALRAAGGIASIKHLQSTGPVQQIALERLARCAREAEQA